MIRRLAAGDGRIFRRIRLEALRVEPASYASGFDDWVALPETEWERRLAENPVLVWIDGGEPVGIIGVIAQSASKMAHRAMVVMVYVRATHRHRGVGRALLDAAVELARDEGLRQLELAVAAENLAARRFYEHGGFKVAGHIPAGFLHEGREIDEVMMVRRLVP